MSLYGEDGELTEEGKNHVVDWFNKNPVKKCSMCDSHSQWDLIKHILYARSYDQGSSAKHSRYPLIALACDNCGNFAFFPAVKIGIVPPDKDGADESD